MKRVSVVIPVHNGEKWIMRAVQSALAQNITAADGLPELFEVIVRDNCSTDGTVAALEPIVLADKRLRIVRGEELLSIGESFRAAFKLAQTKFVTIMGCDDLIDENYLSRVLKEFSAGVAMVGCHPRFIDGEFAPYVNPDDPRTKIPNPTNRTREQWLATFNISNLYFGINTYRTNAVDDVGGFDPKAGWLLDWDLYTRLVKKFEIKVIEEELCSLMLRNDTTSNIPMEKLPEQHKYYRHIREKNFKPTKMKLMIATPFYMSQEFSHYGTSLLYTCRMLTLAGIDWERLEVNGDSYVDRAKNTLLANFLESDGTDLLMIDSDLQWHPNAVARLLQHPEEIVAGAYPFKNSWDQFVGNPLVEIKNGARQYAGYRELTDGSFLIEAYNVSGGFLRIKRAALERFADHYPNDIYQDDYAWPGRNGRIYTEFFKCGVINYQRFSEDSHFAHRCREMGMKLWIDPNITFTHYGVKGWTGNFHESLQRPPEETARLQAAYTAMANKSEVGGVSVVLNHEEAIARVLSDDEALKRTERLGDMATGSHAKVVKAA